MEELYNAHRGDAERELLKALKQNGVDINNYHSGAIVGNQCMAMAKNGNQIMDDMLKGMLPKIKDGTNRKYLKDTCDHTKQMFNLWFELQRTMQSVECQSDKYCARFRENAIWMNKSIHSLIIPPRSWK